jgi:uncharacterized membrane protein YhaH (DUF805 family)
MISGYADFTGRSPRVAVWKFVLLAALGGLVATLVSGLLIESMGDWGIAFLLIYMLALIVPFISLSVRRLNDMGWPAPLALVYLIPVVGMLLIVPLLLLPNAAVAGARKQHNAAVAGARKQNAVARSAARDAATRADEAARALSSAQARLHELEAGLGAYLGSAGQAVLHEFWISVPGYSGPVRGARARTTQHGDVHSVSDVTGQTKGGLGGAVVGGLALGPVGAVVGSNVGRKTTVQTTVRTVDTRSYELEISGPDFMYVLGGPDADSLCVLRDLVNARGSSNEDVKSMAASQRAVVQQHEAWAREASTAADAARTTASEYESRLRAVVAARPSDGAWTQQWAGAPSVETGAGWYPDPAGRHQYRYWTGSGWGSEVANEGRVSVDLIPEMLADTSV